MNEIATPVAAYDHLVDERVDCDAIQKAFLEKLFYVQGKFPKLATLKDYYLALAYTVRDLMLRRWVSTAATYTATRAHGRVLLGRVPARTAARQQPDQSRHL